MSLQIDKAFLLFVLLLNIHFSVCSQTAHKLKNVQHVYGLLNKSIVFCDTAEFVIDEETFETKHPAFVIKNLDSGKNSIVVHNSKPLHPLNVSAQGNYLIIKYGADQQYAKYIVKLNVQGEIIRDFGVAGFLMIPKFHEEKLEFVNLVYDSTGILYVATERRVDSGLKQAVIFKFLSNGNLDSTFGENGLLVSNTISDYQSTDKLSLQNNELILTRTGTSENKNSFVITIKDNGKTIQKKEKVLEDFLFLEPINNELILAIKQRGVDIYDKDLSLKHTIKGIVNNGLTELHYNTFDKKNYIITGGLGEETSKIYELQNDFSVKLIFSAENYNTYALSKDDHITGISFSKDAFIIALSVTESPEKYTYVNYLIQLK